MGSGSRVQDVTIEALILFLEAVFITVWTDCMDSLPFYYYNGSGLNVGHDYEYLRRQQIGT